MNEKVITLLEALAETAMYGDDPNFNPCEFSGGNFDDAYYRGVCDGEVQLARKLLEMLGGDECATERDPDSSSTEEGVE